MSRKTLQLAIAVLFIISGATGLIYQVIWFKYLSLFLGNTTYAQTVVVGTFMAGLAMGAWLWGRRVDVSHKPLLVYAILELGIGVYCLLYPLFLDWIRAMFISIVQTAAWPSDGTTVLALKLAISLLTLLLPTVLMGGTLPVLVKSLSKSVEESGRNVAILYCLNSFGAVLGAALGGFFLVPVVGLQASILGTAAVNLAVGCAALLLSRSPLKRSEEEKESREESERTFTRQEMVLAIVTAGISGLAAMIYEVCWVRLLIPILGSSTYSFSLMVIAFITGITVGSWLVSMFITRIKDLFGFLGVCQVAVAIAFLLTLPLYGRLPYYFLHLAHIIQRSESTYPLFLSLEFVFCLLIMVIPTIFLGMSLPVASRIATHAVEVMGKSIGNVFSVNTLGTVIGSFSGGLLLIPAIGIKHTIEVAVGLNVLMAFVVLFRSKRTKMVPRVGWISAVISIAIIYLAASPNWSQSVMLSGVFRLINKNTSPPGDYASFSGMFTHQHRLFYKEGKSATVAVVESKYGTRMQNILVVNGKADASSMADLPSQTLVGQLPMLLHPHPDSVFVIGLGSGVTLGSVLTHDVKFVDCAEISPEVVEASTFFSAVNNRPLEDPRVNLYVDDALAFLKLTSRTYKVIVSEPTNPWIAGVGNLYTIEFLRQCRGRLTGDGLMVQWFHLYEMDDQTLRLALRSFRAVFPHVTVWQSLTPDIILIGTTQPMQLNAAAIGAKFRNDRVLQNLARIQITDVNTLLSLQSLTEASLEEYSGTGELNTEDRPLLEYSAPRAFFVNLGARRFAAYDDRLSVQKTPLLFTLHVSQTPLSDDDRLRIGSLHTFPYRGNPVFGYSLLRTYHRNHPDDGRVLERLSSVAEQLNRPEEALRYQKRLAELQPNDASTLTRYARLRLSQGWVVASSIGANNDDEAESLLKRSIQLAADTLDQSRVLLGEYYYRTSRFAYSEENYRRALAIRENHEGDPSITQDALLLNLSRTLYQMERIGEAMSYAAQAILDNPANESARDFLNFLSSKTE